MVGGPRLPRQVLHMLTPRVIAHYYSRGPLTCQLKRSGKTAIANLYEHGELSQVACKSLQGAASALIAPPIVLQ